MENVDLARPHQTISFKVWILGHKVASKTVVEYKLLVT